MYYTVYIVSICKVFGYEYDSEYDMSHDYWLLD